MKNTFRVFVVFIIGFLLTPTMLYANSMEPPGTIIIIEGDVKDVEAYIIVDGDLYQGHLYEYLFEKQYWFDQYGIFSQGDQLDIVIVEDSTATSFKVEQQQAYRNTYTYNTKTGLLDEGKSLNRSLILVGMRLALTLIIEGVVFFIFGFRQSQSWLLFIIINLMTQLGLNIYINTIEIATAYPIILILIAEFWIFLIETITIPIFVKEKSKKRKITYALVSNLISLVAGGYILMLLPI